MPNLPGTAARAGVGGHGSVGTDLVPPAVGSGIDIGGSAIKGSSVDLETGSLLADRIQVSTPSPATPTAVLEAIVALLSRMHDGGTLGITFPGIVRNGVIGSAANLDPVWIGIDASVVFGDHLRREVVVVNDADAAGLAEMRFGAGVGRPGVVVVVTLGTGIGTALFTQGQLVPNTELGHIIVAGEDGEKVAAASVRARKQLSWEAWARRLSAYLGRLEALVSPDLIIIGGAISRDHEQFIPLLDAHAEIVPAQLFNDAGIVGAALAAAA